MGWKKRRSKYYYYRSVREGDKVRCIYVGRGVDAIDEAAAVERRRQERQLRKEQLRQLQLRTEAVTRPLKDAGSELDLLIEASRLAARHQQRDRGERRRPHDCQS